MRIMIEMPVGNYYKNGQVQNDKKYYMVDASPCRISNADVFKNIVSNTLNITLVDGFRSADYKTDSATSLRIVLCNLMKALGFVNVKWREITGTERPEFFVRYYELGGWGIV